MTIAELEAQYKAELLAFLEDHPTINTANIVTELERERFVRPLLRASLSNRRSDFQRVDIKTAYNALKGDETAQAAVLQAHEFAHGLDELISKLDKMPRN